MAPPKKTLWSLEPHTRGKHLVLKSYLDAWLPILGTWNGRILFIDGFAGPGEYESGEPGSPIIALDAMKNHIAQSKITAEVVFDFIEKDQDRASHLKALVSARKSTLPSKCKVHVINAAFDEALTSVLDAIEEQKKHLAPAFVMIDPFGILGVRYMSPLCMNRLTVSRHLLNLLRTWTDCLGQKHGEME